MLNERGLELLEKNTIKVRAPAGYWNSASRQFFGQGNLQGLLGKRPGDLSASDFYNNRFGSLLNHCGSSPYKAVSEAFPELGIREWEMAKTPLGFFDSEQHRVAATRWLAEKLKKN